ncbi:hypothetical protein A2U01_0041903, partial [Trifolium medium]|nr:hypothetical protein [Trifolium medium]
MAFWWGFGCEVVGGVGVGGVGGAVGWFLAPVVVLTQWRWFLVYLVDLYRVGIDCLEVVCELRLICL